MTQTFVFVTTNSLTVLKAFLKTPAVNHHFFFMIDKIDVTLHTNYTLPVGTPCIQLASETPSYLPFPAQHVHTVDEHR